MATTKGTTNAIEAKTTTTPPQTPRSNSPQPSTSLMLDGMKKVENRNRKFYLPAKSQKKGVSLNRAKSLPVIQRKAAMTTDPILLAKLAAQKQQETEAKQAKVTEVCNKALRKAASFSNIAQKNAKSTGVTKVSQPTLDDKPFLFFVNNYWTYGPSTNGLAIKDKDGKHVLNCLNEHTYRPNPKGWKNSLAGIDYPGIDNSMGFAWLGQRSYVPLGPEPKKKAFTQIRLREEDVSKEDCQPQMRSPDPKKRIAKCKNIWMVPCVNPKCAKFGKQIIEKFVPGVIPQWKPICQCKLFDLSIFEQPLPERLPVDNTPTPVEVKKQVVKKRKPKQQFLGKNNFPELPQSDVSVTLTNFLEKIENIPVPDVSQESDMPDPKVLINDMKEKLLKGEFTEVIKEIDFIMKLFQGLKDVIEPTVRLIEQQSQDELDRNESNES